MFHVQRENMNELSRTIMKRKPQHAELIETALHGLLRTTGLAAQIIRWEPNAIDHHQPDAVIEIDAHGRKHRFAVEAKTGVRAEVLTQTKALWPREQQPRLLFVAPYITDHLAEKCREINFHFSTPQETHTWRTRTSSFSLLAKKEPQTWPQCIQIEPTPRLG